MVGCASYSLYRIKDCEKQGMVYGRVGFDYFPKCLKVVK